MSKTYKFRTTGFAVALPGYRAAFYNPGVSDETPIVGWMTQAEVAFDPDTCEYGDPPVTALDDLEDLRRRAAQQAQYGNYWAGKCVALADKLRATRQAYEDIIARGSGLGGTDPGSHPGRVT